ncbi:T9SS type A sorting domain-containing protein [Kaistella flava (ex Peng et al. 2021)]|uniref:T9SS type A sorting domain-containing protein n=1 Tax=Kaistella flava (ex Peng et al. 2021) TaxID=2038776 RepID=A0A7M2Y6V3_9FLAO|nr:T9SS type A sorting domain-containing protein [Kaistella flava (ex Peng et al. 2021)]QOW09891.1 T9SS type A sorting domain-containing protein [Kaistella flava (ex Peng et al. 2021)]
MGIVYLSMLDWDTSSRGFIKISSNGNESFTEQILYDSNPALDFQSIHFANETLGFAVGRNNNQGIIWRNGNGINQTMSTKEIDHLEIQIYPNPATTEININFKKTIKENVNIILTDISGKILYSKEFLNKQNIKINTSEFAKGNYILSIKSDQKTFNKKIIIN